MTFLYSVKAINDTMGPTGLFPSLLVYGSLPYFPSGTNNFKDQAARIGVLATARAETENITVVTRIKTALHEKLPPETLQYLRVGRRLHFYRERSKRSEGHYLAPASHIRRHGYRMA